MYKLGVRFNSYDEVVAKYEATEPVVGRVTTVGQDIRPIGDRRRKFEHINKIDDNTYALCDGNYCAYNVTESARKYENDMAPIVWTRRAGGDYIRIRNHARGMQAVSRYDFLATYLPSGMAFSYHKRGVQWVDVVTAPGKSESFILPKNSPQYINGGWHVTDSVYLLFKVHGDGTFTRVGEKLRTPTLIVDKELKRSWQHATRGFFAYCQALGGLLKTDWETRREYIRQIEAWLLANPGRYELRTYTHSLSLGWVPQALVREIFADEEHPLRVAMAVLVVFHVVGHNAVATDADLKAARHAYNKLINKMLGLHKIEEK